MTRFVLTAAAAAGLAAPAAAQDMPLSQILIDGQGWRKVDGSPVKPKAADPLALMGPNAPAGRRPVAAVRSGDTIYAVYDPGGSLWAFPADEKGVVGTGAPYARLRNAPRGGVVLAGGLAADRDGRIYAATEIGVQVFDPTGRLCGVLTPAAKGRPEHLAFEGDLLTHWVGDTKYARRLNTAGAK
ncbi:MAG: hypothetical protein C0501_00190 [Isosphaera sp.]|nr:hypothetical protein [Isosphaera sp.]